MRRKTRPTLNSSFSRAELMKSFESIAGTQTAAGAAGSGAPKANAELSVTAAATPSAAACWLTSLAFALLAGISERNAQIALKKARDQIPWRGHQLLTRQIKAKGGPGGKRLLVALDSLPTELQNRFPSLPSEALIGCVQTFEDEPTSSLDALDTNSTRARTASTTATDNALIRQFEYDVLSVALRHKKHSKERGDAVRLIASSTHRAPNGESMRFSVQAIYRKLDKYESGGALCLGRATRNDKGQRHVMVTRPYDAACPLADNDKREIASALDKYVEKLWRSGMPGWRFVARAATSRLVELSKDAGWSSATLKDCSIPRRIVEKFRPAKTASIYEKDAKKFYDKYDPSILRNVDGILPGEVVEGDVNVIDIPIRRTDGSIAYPRAIAWKCIATNRLFVTLMLPEKGEAVRRENVAVSFMGMCAAFGLPKQLRLDNGSEYSWSGMLDGLEELSRLTHSVKVEFNDNLLVHPRLKAVSRTAPNKPRGKSLEGDFRVVGYGVLAMIPGHVGGNRMLKKSANLGRAPEPYPGTWEEFHRDYETALRFHHTNPQSGKLNGLSPFETYQNFIDEGFSKTHVDEKTLMIAFASEDTRIPEGGYVRWNAQTFYDDALLPYTGRRIRVRVMPLDPRYLFAFDGNQMICAAEPAKTYGYTDSEGAKEQGRRSKVMRRHIAEIRNGVERLDLVAEMRRDLAHRQQTPEAPIGAVITVTPHMQQILDALDAKEDAEDRETFIPLPVEADSVWLPRGTVDKHMAALKYLSEDDEKDDTTDEEP